MSPRPSQLVARGTATLAGAGTPSPGAEARTLLSHVLGVDPSRLVLAPEPSVDQLARYEALLARRAAGEPVQHLTGRAWFRGVDLAVGPGVFTPRPETELMTGWAVARVAHLARPVVVELCAGSGAISRAIAAELPGAEQYAVELDPVAHGWAARNLAGTGVQLVLADMATAFPELDGAVDLVVANPPYIPVDDPVTDEVRAHDPALALWSGADGLDATRVVAAVAARLLRPGGVVCSEHAEVHQYSAPEVFRSLRRAGVSCFGQVADHDDLTGRPRFVTAVRRDATDAACKDGARD